MKNKIKCQRVVDNLSKSLESLLPDINKIPFVVEGVAMEIIIQLQKNPNIRKITYFNSANRFYADIYTKDTRLRMALFEWE